MRDVALVYGQNNLGLAAKLAAELRVHSFSLDEIGRAAAELEGREVIVVHSIVGPGDDELARLERGVRGIAGKVRRIALAIPYLEPSYEDGSLQPVAARVDLLGADHLMLVDPPAGAITAFRTPVISISAYPSIARWLSQRMAADSVVAAPPRLWNRAEAFSELLRVEFRPLPSDDPRDALGLSDRRIVLMWDGAPTCEHLSDIGRIAADYYAVPHVACREQMDEISGRIVASDSVDNPYVKVSLADAMGSAVIAM